MMVEVLDKPQTAAITYFERSIEEKPSKSTKFLTTKILLNVLLLLSTRHRYVSRKIRNLFQWNQGGEIIMEVRWSPYCCH